MKFQIIGFTEEAIIKQVKWNKRIDYFVAVFMYLLSLFVACSLYNVGNRFIIVITSCFMLYYLYRMLEMFFFGYSTLNDELEAFKNNTIVNVIKQGPNIFLELADGKKIHSLLIHELVKSTENVIDFDNGIIYFNDEVLKKDE